MLLLHEVHKVVGRNEEEFEAAYRDYWMPTMAKSDYARLLWYANHALGSGVSYNVVTVTAIKDGRAWEDLARRCRRAISSRGCERSTRSVTTWSARSWSRWNGRRCRNSI